MASLGGVSLSSGTRSRLSRELRRRSPRGGVQPMGRSSAKDGRPGDSKGRRKTHLVARAVHPSVRGRRRRSVEGPELDAELVSRLRRWRVVLGHRDGSGLDRRSLPAPNPAFVSDDEGPIQECQTFHLDIASYCGLDDCPVTAPSPRCERDATRTKTQKQKKDAGNTPGPPRCAARGPWRRARSATTRRRRRARACAPPRACVEINASKGHEKQQPRRQADVGKRSGASSA